ncbi:MULTISPECIES: biotin--[acetyl-CoA-carboxylase] ligase [unclassified Thioalkalivibrio]|uniref:biotin--[acetyl-CoA-carboxylase] ligase n=1 Tax=unclassified Thioalkalivibrio TaxID=2621013 RepID=UPI0003611B1C|nr:MULTISPECIES: biotin--[acetyl-CoA-carboxylase] ligase [unclassified Thioalkalivibrio]
MAPETAQLEGLLRDRLAGTALTFSYVEVLERLDSTNARLLASESTQSGPRVCLARVQMAGRGRRGRAWVASPDASLALSLSWPIVSDQPVPSAYPVGVGLGVIRGLEALGFAGIGLKWPNDVVVGDAKLGGILVEQRLPRSDRLGCLVVGIGLNRRGSGALGLDREVTDLEALSDGQAPDWLALAAEVATWQMRLHSVLMAQGLVALGDDLDRLDVLAGRSIQVPDTGLSGVARGVCLDSGRLRVEDETGVLHHLDAGEVSIRRSGHA